MNMLAVLELLVFSFAHYAMIFILALISYIVGHRVTQTCKFDSLAEQIVFSTALGIGLIACLVFVLGLLHLLYKETVLPALIIATLLCLPDRKAAREKIAQLFTRLSNQKKGLILAALCAAFLLPVFLLPLYPPTSFDATMYHLASAKAYVQNHGLVFLPMIRFSLFPQVNELLFTLMLIIYDGVAAQLIQFLLMALVALGLYAWGRRLFNPKVGFWAAALWLASPLVIWAGASAYIDVGMACFVFFGAYAFSNWMDTDDTSWVVLSAALLGFAAAAKYSALFFVALAGLLLLGMEIKRRRLRNIALFTVVAAAAAVPWYVRSVYYTGNPFFPFLAHIFGYGYLSVKQVQDLVHDMTAGYGTAKTFTNFLLLPWNLIFRGTLFNTEAPITPVYLFMLPVLIFYGIINSRIRLLIGIVLFYMVFWFATSQVSRYLISILPFLSLAVAASLDMLLKRTWSPKRPKPRFLFTICVALVFVFPSWVYALRQIRGQGLPPATKEAKEVFLQKRAPGYVSIPYGAIRYLNEVDGTNYSVYALYAENMVYFVDGTWRGGDWIGPNGYDRILGAMSSGKALYNELHSMKADYFLYTTNRYQTPLPQDVSFERKFRLVYAAPYVQLFQLAKQGASFQRATGQEILKNPRFEDIVNGKPAGWESQGAPRIDPAVKPGHHPACGDAGNFFMQSVPVSPDRFYALSAFVKAKRSGTGRLHINWHNERGDIINVDIEDVKADTDWKQSDMIVKSPRTATVAQVILDVYGDSVVCYDDLSLREVRWTPSPSKH